MVIEEWAKPYLERHLAPHDGSRRRADRCRDLTDFRRRLRYKVYWFHEQACAALKIEDLTVHDARHSLAVRWRKHGIALEVIAAQLGHANVLQVATIYGRFQPTMDEREAEVKS